MNQPYQNPNHQYQQQYAQPGQQQYGQPYGQPDNGLNPAWVNNDAFASGPSGKSRGVFALLALFLGAYGIQYFYLGKVMPGLVMLLGYGTVLFTLTVISCIIWITWPLVFIIGLFPLLQGILVFCKSNQQFEEKFCNPYNSFPLF